MEEKLFKKLDNLNIIDTNLLLEKDIKLKLNYFTMKRIEKSVMKKTENYNINNTLIHKINDILGGIIMKRKIALVLFVVAVSSLGGGVYAHAKTTPVAYISLDINPSVELGVNTFDQVVSAEAYNADGEKVLEGTNLIDSDVDNAVSTVVTNAITDGYVKEDGTSAIEITASTDKENVADKLKESLKESVEKTLKNNNIEAVVETENIALARRDEARKLGITPGKLNLIQKLQVLDPAISIEDYKSSSVKDIQKKAIELKKMNTDNQPDNDAEKVTDANTTTDINADVIAQENTNNGAIKKEENANSNSKKEDINIADDKEKDTTIKQDKQSDNGKVNSENKNDAKGKNKTN